MRPEVISCLLFLAACGEATIEVGEARHGTDAHETEHPEPAPGVPVDLGEGLVREKLRAGHGPEAGAGSAVTFHYASFLAESWDADGEPEPFDSSTSRHVPLELKLGSGPAVIEGLARGLIGLCAGDEAVLRVPAELGWGEQGNPAFGVPAEADLVFELRVLEVK